MHCENLSASARVDPPVFDEPAEPVDDAPLCVAVEPSWATWLDGDPPHAAASRTSPVVAMIAAAVRTTTSVAAVPVPGLKTGRSSARAQERDHTFCVSAHSPRVVLVEDEEPVRQAVERALRREGIAVTGFSDYPGPEPVLAAAPDLAVLDVLLPSGDGFELARELRAARDLPIVFLTARDAVEDRLDGFDLGADDYLVKPFALEELLARVRAVLRRTGRLGAAIEAGDVVVDEQAGLATRTGSPLELTPTELRLLAYLVRQRGLVLSKHQLLTQVWGYDSYDPNVVEVHVSALRRKLEARGPRILHTVRGLGYRLDPR
jgi:DNA-binding response OmpR family regulator